MAEGVGLASFAGMAATDLPMGARKLLEIARALMAKPRVLLLDEPAANMAMRSKDRGAAGRLQT